MKVVNEADEAPAGGRSIVSTPLPPQPLLETGPEGLTSSELRVGDRRERRRTEKMKVKIRGRTEKRKRTKITSQEQLKVHADMYCEIYARG